MANTAANEPIDAEETIKSGEALLNSGETESLIAQAEETIARARAQGRSDIVEQAQAVIANLTEKHNKMVESQHELIDAVEGLRAAQKKYDDARAEYEKQSKAE